MSSEQDHFNKVCESARAKVSVIFTEMAGDRARRLHGLSQLENSEIFAQALAEGLGDDVAKEIAFHLTDWKEEAAFLVAVLLFRERFTPEEIANGSEGLFCHAAHHMATASVLAGYHIPEAFQADASEHPEERA